MTRCTPSSTFSMVETLSWRRPAYDYSRRSACAGSKRTGVISQASSLRILFAAFTRSATRWSSRGARTGSGARSSASTEPDSRVRCLFTPPERGSFQPTPPPAPSTPLRLRCSDPHQNGRGWFGCLRENRPGETENDPKWACQAGPVVWIHGSEGPHFWAVPADRRAPEKNGPTGDTGGGRGVRPETFSTFEHTRAEDVARVGI
jgi:hypothetical protein